MKRLVLISSLLLSLTLLGGCTQPDRATEALQRDGYTNIQIEGYAWWGCGSDDTFRTKFTATKNGHYVEGVYCSALTKGGTIRTF